MAVKRAAPPKVLKKKSISKNKTGQVFHEARATELLRSISEAKSLVKEMGAQISEWQTELVNVIEATGNPSYTASFQDEGGKQHRVRGTVVRGTRLVIDEGKLKTRLGAAMWNKVTTRVLDRKKLDAFIASNEIDVGVVASASSEQPNAPYVKITNE